MRKRSKLQSVNLDHLRHFRLDAKYLPTWNPYAVTVKHCRVARNIVNFTECMPFSGRTKWLEILASFHINLAICMIDLIWLHARTPVKKDRKSAPEVMCWLAKILSSLASTVPDRDGTVIDDPSTGSGLPGSALRDHRAVAAGAGGDSREVYMPFSDDQRVFSSRGIWTCFGIQKGPITIH